MLYTLSYAKSLFLESVVYAVTLIGIIGISLRLGILRYTDVEDIAIVETGHLD
jgi:hypothetical protein